MRAHRQRCRTHIFVPPLSVTVAPINITTQPMSLTVNRNDTAEFTVVATGGGLTYQWQKDGADLNGTDNELEGISGATLRVLNAQNDDEGSYTCVVTNAGSDMETSSAATLTVGRLSRRYTCKQVHQLLLACVCAIELWCTCLRHTQYIVCVDVLSVAIYVVSDLVKLKVFLTTGLT